LQPQENAARDLSEARLNNDKDLRLEIQHLGEDIKARGCLTPLLVRPSGSVYIVLDGNRRLAAAKWSASASCPAWPSKAQ
jgi:ParB-like chromosome segregation protein Spo0J